jgi:hypothetical protein
MAQVRDNERVIFISSNLSVLLRKIAAYSSRVIIFVRDIGPQGATSYTLDGDVSGMFVCVGIDGKRGPEIPFFLLWIPYKPDDPLPPCGDLYQAAVGFCTGCVSFRTLLLFLLPLLLLHCCFLVVRTII